MNANSTNRFGPYEVTATWESGFRLSLPFVSHNAALRFVQAIHGTPPSMGRLASVVPHRIATDGTAESVDLPFCRGGVWFHANGEPVADGFTPGIVPANGES